MSNDKILGEVTLNVRFGGCSIQGKRSTNEDAFVALMPQDKAVAQLKGAAACIADGGGIKKQATTVSQTACESFMQDYYATPEFWTVKHSASRVIEAINAWFYQQDRGSLSPQLSAGANITSFSALIVKSHTAHIFHVGDCRIYRLEHGQIEQLLNDHCYSQGNLAPQLIRALGIETFIDIDYLSVPVAAGDRFLLCTDGIHGTLTTHQIELLFKKTSNDLEAIAKSIVDAALQNGSQDNLTALIVEIDTLPPEQIDELYRTVSHRTIPPVLNVGDSIDHFTIEQVIASGSRSHVYLAKNQIDQKKYVLKMPSQNLKNDEVYLKGFAHEQWIGNRLDNENIIKVYDLPKQSKYLYHISDFIDGITLKQWMTEQPYISLEAVQHMLHLMIKPVRHLHRNGLIHRDLKPENFIINKAGEVKLIDLGTVKIGGIHELALIPNKELPVGDIGYIAPELLVYGRSTYRSDLFSLASIVYQMLTKELPYTAILSTEDFPKRFDLWEYRPIQASKSLHEIFPPWVDNVLQKALMPDPKHRYSTLSEFETDLRSPNQDIIKAKIHIPLVERNPLVFWKVLTVCFMIAFLIQSIYLISNS